MQAALVVVSHNNCREGAPRQAAKLAAGLRHSFRSVATLALQGAAADGGGEPCFRIAKPPDVLALVQSELLRGHVVLVLSTVISCRHAAAIRSAIDKQPATDRHRLTIVGLVHEVRNATFAWVQPAHLQGVDRLVFVAGYTEASYGPEFAPGVPRHVIHNWLSAAERNAVDSACPPPPSPGAPVVVLMVGVVAPHKGQLDVARAFARLAADFPGAKLVLLGTVYDPKYADRIREVVSAATVAGAEERVVIAGAVSHPDVLRAMQSCTVLVHASPMESCCLSIMEAMYAGAAVLATRVGGIPEQITHGSDGLLFELGDVPACEAAMRELLSDPDRRRSLGARARCTVASRFREHDKLALFSQCIRPA